MKVKLLSVMYSSMAAVNRLKIPAVVVGTMYAFRHSQKR